MQENNRAAVSVEELMYSTAFEGLSQYKSPCSRELEGKSFDIAFDDGCEMDVSFPSRGKILYSENGGSACLETCRCMKAADTAYLVLVERRGAKPRAGFMLVLDLESRLVTGNFVQQGAVSSFPGLVTRTVRFGAIRDGDKPLPENRHHFTDELVGRKIEWTYNPDFHIIHVYLTPDSYCFALNPEMRRRTEEARQEQDRGPMRPVREPSIYIKLRDNLFLFSWIEENGGSGTEGLIVANTDSLTDVGCFFGLNPEGKPEAYLFSAYGRWVEEHLPEEDLFS